MSRGDPGRLSTGCAQVGGSGGADKPLCSGAENPSCQNSNRVEKKHGKARSLGCLKRVGNA